MGEPCYLLVKRDLYYRPDNRGYTGIKDKAGRYLASEADEASGVTAIHEDDAPMFSKACWEDVKVSHLMAIIAERDRTIAAWNTRAPADLRSALEAETIERCERRARIQEALLATLDNSLDCTRVWSAWGYGTMGQDDFVPVLERLDELVDEFDAIIFPAALAPTKGDVS